MQLQDTVTYKGRKHVVIGKPIFASCSIQFVEIALYGIPLHKQERKRFYVSEIEREQELARAAEIDQSIVSNATPCGLQFDENLGGYSYQPKSLQLVVDRGQA